MKRRDFLASAITVLAGAGLFTRNSYGAGPGAGIMQKIRSVFAFDTSIDADRFARDCRDWGIDLAILHPGFFTETKMTRALKKNGIKLWLNFPVFYNPEFLAKNPDYYSITRKGRKAIHDWCHFVCPGRTDYINQLISDSAVLAAKLQPTLISLDFIRHYVFWELVDLNGDAGQIEDGCYCPVCLDAFTKSTGLNIPSDSPAEFIQNRVRTEWGNWKSRRITDTAQHFISSLRKASPASKIWIKTVPWKANDLEGAIVNSAGQDIPALGVLVDGIAPMAFTHVLRRNPAWKKALLEEVKTITGKPVISYLQTEKIYREEIIPARQFEEELATGLKENYAGISIFCYEQLVQAPEKVAILRKYLAAGKSI